MSWARNGGCGVDRVMLLFFDNYTLLLYIDSNFKKYALFFFIRLDLTK